MIKLENGNWEHNYKIIIKNGIGQPKGYKIFRGNEELSKYFTYKTLAQAKSFARMYPY